VAARPVHVTSAYVRRWSVPMRLVHWTLAGAFLGLLSSGLALESPDLRGIPFLGSKLVREAHLSFAVLAIVLPALAASWDGFNELRSFWGEVRRFADSDVRWLLGVCRRLVGWRGSLPSQGRLNAGQKLNVLVLASLLCCVALSGAIIAPEAGRPVPQVVRELAYEIHRLLAYATLPIVAVHIVLATVWPATRPALRGILVGSVRSDWAQAHHGLWTPDADAGMMRRYDGADVHVERREVS
jgi:formate dehydrogenase gamma subunit